MKKIIVIIITGMLFLGIWPEGGFQFIYIDINPVTAAMGECGNSGSQDFLRNPANSGNTEYFNLFANHTEYFWGTRFENLGINIPLGNGNIGFDIRGIYSDDIPVYTNSQGDSAFYRYISALFTVNYSMGIGERIQAGVNIKPLYSTVYDYTAFGVLFDAGIQYSIMDNLNAGISAGNAGLNLKYADSDYMPLTIRAGLSYMPAEMFLVATDVNYYAGNSMFEAGIGIEYIVANVLALRTGYIFNSANTDMLNNFRGGLGVHMGPIALNYGASYNNQLGLVHIAGISYDYSVTSKSSEKERELIYAEMERKLEEKEQMMSSMFINKAKDDIDEKDYISARENIDLALIWYPDSEEGRILDELIEKSAKQWELDRRIDTGIDYYINADYINALNYFESVLEIDPLNEKALKYRTKAQGELAKIKEKEQFSEKLDEALEWYKKGNYIKSRSMLYDMYNNENIEEAEKYLNTVNEKINGIVAEAIAEIRIYIKKGQYVTADKKINTIMKYNVRIEELQSLRNEIQSVSGSETQQLMETAMQYYSKQDYKRAEEYFQKVIVIDSSNQNARTYLEKIKAMNIYSIEDIEELYLKGIEAYTNDEFRLAVQYWQKCLDIKPDYSKAKKNIAKAQKKIEELED